jgi:predicted HicB family RNase H-like nuclease
MEYKGYSGKVEYDDEAGVFHMEQTLQQAVRH